MSLIIGLFNTLFFRPIFNLLMSIYAAIHSLPMSFAFSIVLMTLIIRTLLIPVFVKQLQSSKAMQVIQPQVQAIQRQYRSEPQVMQQKLSALYKENGVNPYMGCLPLLVQLPFLWSVYGALRTIFGAANDAAKYHSIARGVGEVNGNLYPFVSHWLGTQGVANLLQTTHLTFFGAIMFFGINLAKPDPTHLLPILAGLLTFAQMRMTQPQNKPKPAPGTAPDPNAATMQMMQYIFPFITVFIGWNFYAGLALYWVVTTSFTIMQQYFVNGRSWGGLLKGIPGLDPTAKFGMPGAPAPALVGASLPPTASARRNQERQRIIDADPAVTRTTSTKTRVVANGDAKLADAKTNATVRSPNGTRPVPPTNGSRPAQRSVTAKNGAGRPATKSSVRLVTNTGGPTNGANGAVVAPRTSVKPKSAVNGQRATTGSAKIPSKARKGGR